MYYNIPSFSMGAPGVFIVKTKGQMPGFSRGISDVIISELSDHVTSMASYGI